MTLTLSIILVISILLNVGTVLYARKAASELLVVASNIVAVKEVIESFRGSVAQLHESEMFYGDASLQNLITQSELVLDTLDNHENIYTLVIDEEEEDLYIEED